MEALANIVARIIKRVISDASAGTGACANTRKKVAGVVTPRPSLREEDCIRGAPTAAAAPQSRPANTGIRLPQKGPAPTCTGATAPGMAGEGKMQTPRAGISVGRSTSDTAAPVSGGPGGHARPLGNDPGDYGSPRSRKPQTSRTKG